MEYFDFWNAENEMVKNAYASENIKVVDYSDIKVCYIFFSSHGLYFPNTLEEFEEKVVKQNRFEWENIASSKEIRKVCGRAIFVRDIYKQYYVSGINKRENSIDKLLVKLKQLTQGYQVITVGSSAGGYMAMLVGAVLKATDCFSFSGQVSLYLQNRIESCPFLKQSVEDSQKNKYFDITDLIKESNLHVWYFYPYYNEADKEEFGYIKAGKSVKGFAFALSNHAETMYAENMKHIISKNEKKLEKLYRHYEGKVIKREDFLFRSTSIATIFLFYKKKTIRFIKRRLKR